MFTEKQGYSNLRFLMYPSKYFPNFLFTGNKKASIIKNMILALT